MDASYGTITLRQTNLIVLGCNNNYHTGHFYCGQAHRIHKFIMVVRQVRELTTKAAETVK